MTGRILLLIACAAVAAACDGSGSRSGCVPGTTQACLGTARCEGVQTCNAEGNAFDACLCGAAPQADAGPGIRIEHDAGLPLVGTDAGGRTDPGHPIDGGRSEDVGAGSGGPYRVFVTSATYTGDIRREPASPGLESADMYCQLAATAASLGGTWRAFLSTESVDAIDRVAGEGPWVNMVGATIFPNRAALEVSAPMASMSYNENGELAATYVWTGSTGAKRHRADASCQGWTSTDFPNYGELGDLYSTSATGWVSDQISDCGYANALLCFEQ